MKPYTDRRGRLAAPRTRPGFREPRDPRGLEKRPAGSPATFERRANLGPRPFVCRVRRRIREPPVDFGALLVRDRHRGGFRHDAVPDGLNELDSFRNREAKSVVEYGRRHGAIIRRLTISSSAASVASPLQRVVRRTCGSAVMEPACLCAMTGGDGFQYADGTPESRVARSPRTAHPRFDVRQVRMIRATLATVSTRYGRPRPQVERLVARPSNAGNDNEQQCRQLGRWDQRVVRVAVAVRKAAARPRRARSSVRAAYLFQADYRVGQGPVAGTAWPGFLNGRPE